MPSAPTPEPSAGALEAFADRDWWAPIGKLVDLGSLVGWDYRSRATFEHGELSGRTARAIKTLAAEARRNALEEVKAKVDAMLRERGRDVGDYATLHEVDDAIRALAQGEGPSDRLPPLTRTASEPETKSVGEGGGE